MGFGLSKISNFPRVVKQEIDSAAKRSFTWGEHDCCMWAGDVVKKIASFDPCWPFRDRYHDLAAAVEEMRRYISPDRPGSVWHLFDAVTVKLGDENGLVNIPVSKVQSGDLVVLNLPQSPIGGGLAIQFQGRAWTPHHQGGMADVSLSQAVRAWRI